MTRATALDSRIAAQELPTLAMSAKSWDAWLSGPIASSDASAHHTPSELPSDGPGRGWTRSSSSDLARALFRALMADIATKWRLLLWTWTKGGPISMARRGGSCLSTPEPPRPRASEHSGIPDFAQNLTSQACSLPPVVVLNQNMISLSKLITRITLRLQITRRTKRQRKCKQH